jgi:hypothetical protein
MVGGAAIDCDYDHMLRSTAWRSQNRFLSRRRAKALASISQPSGHFCDSIDHEEKPYGIRPMRKTNE